jgi:phosphate transport system substrate-binding protein
VCIAVTAMCAPAWSDTLSSDSSFCDGKGTSVVGEGSLSQVPVHADVFAPAYGTACARGAGLVSYLGTSDQLGIRAIQSRTRGFGTSDVPMTTSEKIQADVGANGWTSPIHQIPLYVDGWAIAYNVPCSGPALKLSSGMLSLIYSGTITQWDDPQLQQANPWLASCDETVRVARRADPSGATGVFQDYLSKRNPQWLAFKNGGTWPAEIFACKGLGDLGMVNCINNNRGAIGYLEMAVALENAMQIAQVDNVTGSYVGAGAVGCSAAAAAAVTPPGTGPYPVSGVGPLPFVPSTEGDWSTVSITDARDGLSGPKSYPICSFSYAFVVQSWWAGYGRTVGIGMARSVVDYLSVALRDSTQAKLAVAGYAALPPSVREVGRQGLASISYFNLTTAGF